MEELTLADYFAILRRWKKLFAVTAVLLLALSLSKVFAWSNYRSMATVQIEQSEISANATTPFGSSPREQMEALADQRISALQQKVLSTASLIEVIAKFNLYASARESAPVALIAEGMRKKIKLNLVSSTLANPSAGNKGALSAIAFTLSFDYSDPLRTQQVTDELVSRFLDADLKERRAEAKKTSAFLASQIATLEQSLAEQEKKIADYQKEHGIIRPEALAFNQQLAATLTTNIQSIDAQIATNEGSLGALRAQLAAVDPYSRVIADGQVLTSPSVQLKALQAQYATLSSQYGPEHPDVVKTKRQIEALLPQAGRASKETGALKAQIADARANLDAAEKTYGSEHPDVVALRNRVHDLEDRLATRKTGPQASVTGVVSDADNPAYLQYVAQIKSLEEQGKSLRQQREGLQDQLQGYQKALIENPEAQKEMAQLTRDYDNAQLRYRELKAKKMTADMEEQMQNDRTGQRLSLVDPPELPIGTQPGRKILLLACIFLSFMGALTSVVVAQILRPGIVGVRYFESVVGVSPLVVIPHIYTNEERETSVALRLIAAMKKAAVFAEPYRRRMENRLGRFSRPQN